MSSDCLTVAWINRMRHNIVNITMGAEPSGTNGMKWMEAPSLTEWRMWNVGKIESLFEDIRVTYCQTIAEQPAGCTSSPGFNSQDSQ